MQSELHGLDLPARGQEPRDILIQEFGVRGIAGRSCRVSPQRWYRHQRDSGNEGGFITRVADWEVEIGFRRHVKDGNFDRAQGLLHVSVEPYGGADIMTLPGSHLEDEVVGVCAGNEIGAEIVQYLVEGSALR